MSKLKNRAAPLTSDQRHKFVTGHLPWRLQFLRDFLDAKRPTASEMVAAVLFARVVANFLGFKSRGAALFDGDDEYFRHLRNPDLSYEVKLQDLGHPPLKFTDLLPGEKAALEAGLLEFDKAFAHLTYWDNSTNESPGAGATAQYEAAQQKKFRDLVSAVVAIYHRTIAKVSVDKGNAGPR